jgi:hypothetical protein
VVHDGMVDIFAHIFTAIKQLDACFLLFLFSYIKSISLEIKIIFSINLVYILLLLRKKLLIFYFIENKDALVRIVLIFDTFDSAHKILQTLTR